MDLKAKIEAILFASGTRLTVEQLSKLVREPDTLAIRAALLELQKDYENRPIMIIEEADHWKITVREKYVSFAKKVVSQTELPKSLLETLSIIALKAPVLQSIIIKTRTNKSYDQLNRLEQSGYITRTKQGRTKLIRLTKKFYDYFETTEEELKQKLAQKAEKLGKLDVYENKVETVTEPLPLAPLEAVEEKVGEMDVYDKKETEVEVFNQTAEQVAELEKFTEEEKETSEEEPSVEEEAPNEEMATEEPQKDILSQPVAEEKQSMADILEQEVKKLSPEQLEKEYQSKGIYPEGVPKELQPEVDKRAKKIIGQNDTTP